MKQLNDYTIEQLKSLYQNLKCYAVTEYFIYLRRYDTKTKKYNRILDLNAQVKDKNEWRFLTEAELLNINENHGVNDSTHTLIYKSKYWNLDYEIHNTDFETRLDEWTMNLRKVAIGTCYNIYNFFTNKKKIEDNKSWHNGEYYHVNDYMIEDGLPMFVNQFMSEDEIEEWYEELRSGYLMSFVEKLHETDELNRELGIATDEEVYYFIWDTLQHCTLKELCTLKDYARKEWKIKKAHRPSKNKKIYKYDKDKNLVATFNNRNECIEVDKINKSVLSKILSKKFYNKSYNGYYYIEEE